MNKWTIIKLCVELVKWMPFSLCAAYLLSFRLTLTLSTPFSLVQTLEELVNKKLVLKVLGVFLYFFRLSILFIAVVSVGKFIDFWAKFKFLCRSFYQRIVNIFDAIIFLRYTWIRTFYGLQRVNCLHCVVYATVEAKHWFRFCYFNFVVEINHRTSVPNSISFLLCYK